MRTDDEVRQVFRLAAEGLSRAQIARRVGIARATVRDWLDTGEEAVLQRRGRVRRRELREPCSVPCQHTVVADRAAFAYLLGQYLGDGYVSQVGGSARLRVFCCDAYPGIMQEVADAMVATVPEVCARRVQRQGCTDVYSTWRHWPCLLPHGPGLKHLRAIELTPVQRTIALDEHPERFLRGLLHSDGCRCINRVQRRGRTYEYPRYMFTNKSDDIQALFLEACRRLGVDARNNNRWSISIARRRSVELVDRFVGPKA